MPHADQTRLSRAGTGAAVLAAIVLSFGCSTTTVHNWKPQRMTSGAASRVSKAKLRPGTVITPQDILDDAHEATRTVWCSIPGPGGKMIWVQVK